VRKILNNEVFKLKNQLNYQKMILERENLVGLSSSHHSYDILGVRMLWNPKEARIL